MRNRVCLFIWGQGGVFCFNKVSENFVGLSQILKEQSGEILFDVYTHQIAIIKKYENLRIKRKNRVSRVVGTGIYADTRFSNFAIEFLHEN